MTDGPLRLAHRGDWRRAPENSLAAMRAALAIPACDGLEFDVRSAADGTPVLLHDETLERVQGRPDRVGDLRPDALAAHGIPTLAEMLAATPADAFLDVELKGQPDLGPIIDVLTAARGPALDGAVVSAFEPDTLALVRERAPAWPCWLNLERLDPFAVAIASGLGCRGVSVEWRGLDPAAMRRAAAADLDVAAWTVRRLPTFERLARLGVVAVCVEASALDGRSPVSAG
jgi:glycerophosphoryl diester phosphodiesterase